MQYKRLMGIDYGDRRIGIAFTDLLQMLSNPHSIYQSVDMQTDAEYIANLAKQNSVEKIIIGLPLCMDGSENERTEITKNFGAKLAKLSGLEIIYEDERLSSVEAEDILRENKVSPKDRKKHLDKLSAAIILQTYLNSRK
ncbi:MAG: Holliday junction resolvase RuvX [Clostridia bacterium]|nr:Holliday junction resolvase RuvX [Clostridia bacterium]